MMKKAIFFTDGDLPHRTGGGCPVHMYGILRLLQLNKFEVTIVPCNYSDQHIKREAVEFLAELNVKVLLMPILRRKRRNRAYFLRNFINPKMESFTGYSLKDIPTILGHKDVRNAQLLYGFNWECVPLLSAARIPTVLSLVDLIDDFIQRKESSYKNYRGIKRIRSYVKNRDFHGLSKSLYRHLYSVDYIIQHAHQHYEKLVSMGFQKIKYIPHPLVRPFEIKEPDPPEDVLKLIILGSLKGVASKLGFRYFFEEVVPLIKDSRFDKKLDVVIGGHGEPDEFLIEKCKEYSSFISFKGYLKHLEPHIKEAHALLVVIPVGHGFRTRIAEMMGIGLPVVAHKANSEGMPELIDNYNALLSDNPKKMLSDIKRLMKNKSLLGELHRNGKQTFDEQISMQSARVKYSDVLNQVL